MEFGNFRNYGQSKCNVCGDVKLDGTNYVKLCVGCKLQVHCDCGHLYASHFKGFKFYCANCLWMPPPGRVAFGKLKWPPPPPNAGMYNLNLRNQVYVIIKTHNLTSSLIWSNYIEMNIMVRQYEIEIDFIQAICIHYHVKLQINKFITYWKTMKTNKLWILCHGLNNVVNTKILRYLRTSTPLLLKCKKIIKSSKANTCQW